MKKNKIKESAPEKVKIRLVPTGVPGLDDIFGGGLPEFSFNLIAGAPGCGKTTLRIKSSSPMRPRRSQRFISPYSANPHSKCCVTSSNIPFSTRPS